MKIQKLHKVNLGWSRVKLFADDGVFSLADDLTEGAWRESRSWGLTEPIRWDQSLVSTFLDVWYVWKMKFSLHNIQAKTENLTLAHIRPLPLHQPRQHSQRCNYRETFEWNFHLITEESSDPSDDISFTFWHKEDFQKVGSCILHSFHLRSHWREKVPRLKSHSCLSRENMKWEKLIYNRINIWKQDRLPESLTVLYYIFIFLWCHLLPEVWVFLYINKDLSNNWTESRKLNPRVPFNVSPPMLK